jgi:hypothetical protein
MGDLITNPAEAKLETLLQIMACLIERLGGEVVIGRKEFTAFEGVPVVGRNLSGGYVVLRLGDEDEAEFIELPSDPT